MGSDEMGAAADGSSGAARRPQPAAKQDRADEAEESADGAGAAEVGEGVSLAAKHKIDGYPTYVFFAPDGSVLGSEVGAMEAPTFLKLMQSYADKAKRRADSSQRGMKMATPSEKASLSVLFQKQ
jgi:thioredoxin-related protein